MRQLLDLIVVTAIQMGNFMLLFFLFLYIYALLGMQFFAGRMRFDDFGYPVDIKVTRNHALIFLPACLPAQVLHPSDFLVSTAGFNPKYFVFSPHAM